jgi:hypothetical protein
MFSFFVAISGCLCLFAPGSEVHIIILGIVSHFINITLCLAVLRLQLSQCSLLRLSLRSASGVIGRSFGLTNVLTLGCSDGRLDECGRSCMPNIGIAVVKALIASVLAIPQDLFDLRRLDAIALAHVSVSLNRSFSGDLLSTFRRSTALRFVLGNIDACFIVVVLMNTALRSIRLAIEYFAISVSSNC